MSLFGPLGKCYSENRVGCFCIAVCPIFHWAFNLWLGATMMLKNKLVPLEKSETTVTVINFIYVIDFFNNSSASY